MRWADRRTALSGGSLWHPWHFRECIWQCGTRIYGKAQGGTVEFFNVDGSRAEFGRSGR